MQPSVQLRAPARARRLLLLPLLLGTALLLLLPMRPAAASETSQIVHAVNDARAAHGLRALKVSGRLQRSSARYSAWMVDHEFFGHRATLSLPHRFWLRGEVLAKSDEHDPGASDIVQQWLDSPLHRAVLLDPRFQFVGIGIARGQLGSDPMTLITGHFGARRSALAGRAL
jgi:uncharacterized protein YkwD